MSISTKLYASLAPAIFAFNNDELLLKIYKADDLYWAFESYKIECRNGNKIHCQDFYGRKDRMRHVLQARRLLAICVLISRLYPKASWERPTFDFSPSGEMSFDQSEERNNAVHSVRG